MADLGMILRIQAVGADGAEQDIDRVSVSADKLERKSNEASKRVDGLGRSLDHAGGSAKRASEHMNLIGKAIAGVVTIQAVRKIFDIGDNYRAMSERVRMATNSIGEFQYAQDRLLKSANTSFRPLAEAQEMFIATSGNLRAMGYSLGQSLDITDSLSFAFVRNATSAQRAESAIINYDKALSRGIMNGEQWRVFSGAVETVAKNIGDVYGKTAQEIDKMGHDGLLTVQMINEGLRRSLNENKVAADSMANTVGDSFVKLNNEFSHLWGNINESLGVTSLFSSTIIGIADNLEYALIPALGLGAIGAGKLASSALLSANSLRGATLESFRYQAALAKMTGVSNLAAKSMVTTSIAAKGLSSTMAFLGGPVGVFATVVTAAAGGLMLFSSNSKDAKMQASLLQTEIDELTNSLSKMTNAQVEASQIRYTDKFFDFSDQKKSLESDIKAMEEMLAHLQKQYDRYASQGVNDISTSIQIDKHRRRLAFLREEYDGVLESLGLVNSALDSITERAKTAGSHLFAMGAWSEIIGFNSLIKGGADQQAIFNTNTQELSSILKNVEEQYRNIGLTTSQIALNRALELDIGLKEFALLKQMLDAIDDAPKLTGKTSLNYFDDALKSINNELISTRALTQDLTLFGDPSQYTAFSEMTMQLNDTKGVLANITASQRELLLYKAQELDSQKQINAILELGRNTTQDLDDLEFEISLFGKSRKEIERLTFFRNLDSDARLISIGMTDENIKKLTEEIEKKKELYGLTEKKREDQENSIGAGIEAGFQQYIDNIGTMRDSFADATQSVFSNIEGFLVDFAHTGKLNFRDMTTSILQDLSRIMIQMAMMEAVTGMQGWMKGLGLFSGGGSVPISPGIPYQLWTGGHIPEYATGGQVIDFSGGGFTGAGDKFEPKGVVHGGEFVFSKESVNKIGLENLNRLHKGYSAGGLVGNAGNLGGGSGVVINQTFQIESGANIDEQMIKKLQYEMRKEAMKISENISLRTIGDQKRSGGMLRG